MAKGKTPVGNVSLAAAKGMLANSIVVGATVQAQVANAPLVQYGLGKLPRNGLNQGTKHGTGGTAGTYAAVCAALAAANGALALPAIQAVCKANGDPGFARYAVRNHWLLPVQPS